MNRRQFLAGAGALAANLTPLRVLATEPEGDAKDRLLAPPCGLYCGTCDEFAAGRCHGCGCGCGKCHGKFSADHCEIYACATSHRVEHCGVCTEFPCTKLIGASFDPTWLPQGQIENLRRRVKIRTKPWIVEQRKHWTPDRKRALHLALAECKARQERLKLKHT